MLGDLAISEINAQYNPNKVYHDNNAMIEGDNQELPYGSDDDFKD